MQKRKSSKINQIPPITNLDTTDLVQQLLLENLQLRQALEEMTNLMAAQKELIQQLRDEIARLKGQKPKPNISPSNLEGPGSKPDLRKRIDPTDRPGRTIVFAMWVHGSVTVDTPFATHCFSTIASTNFASQDRFLDISRLARAQIKAIKRIGKPGQPKGTRRKKKRTVLPIHDQPVIRPAHVPPEAIFKGFCYYTVQDLIIKSHNVQYKLERWQLPNGSYVTGELPKDVHGHYGPQLVAYILHQYHACRVTEPLLLNQLRSIGVQMSAGQLSNILLQHKEAFVQEAAELLPVGAKADSQVQVDDTGGRHKGQNQYTTIISNRWFSVFTTTESKSRVNFLQLLQNGQESYVINEDTIEYLSQVNAPTYLPGYLRLSLGDSFATLAEWEAFLCERNIVQNTERRFVTEAALYASVIQTGLPRDLGVHSDDAGQFDVFLHSLCWIHEERHYRKLIMTTDTSRKDLECVRDQIWTIYQALKSYKKEPSQNKAASIEKQFDEIFQQKTSSPILNSQLAKTYAKKQELLVVLQRPETPLHNNSSETCARAAKIKLKISGGTRSDHGQVIRDVFLSLKQTCRKLEINFWSYLQDRVRGLYEIPRLATIICERALAGAKNPPHVSSTLFTHPSVFQSVG